MTAIRLLLCLIHFFNSLQRKGPCWQVDGLYGFRNIFHFCLAMEIPLPGSLGCRWPWLGVRDWCNENFMKALLWWAGLPAVSIQEMGATMKDSCYVKIVWPLNDASFLQIPLVLQCDFLASTERAAIDTAVLSQHYPHLKCNNTLFPCGKKKNRTNPQSVKSLDDSPYFTLKKSTILCIHPVWLLQHVRAFIPLPTGLEQYAGRGRLSLPALPNPLPSGDGTTK